MMALKLVAFILIVSAVKTRRCDESSVVIDGIVHTESGPVRGQQDETIFRKTKYFSFKGIPYAKVPVGDLRFKAPQNVADWTPNVRDAIDFGNTCVQVPGFFNVSFPESEDCLFLNIFTPDLNPNEKLSVIFYIHGGAFIMGSSNEFYGPDFLIEQRVIVVTINYRVGVFGFLSLGLPEYSGNMGLKDQQMALKWIHKNIHHFGGDNKQITVAGHSAGGASAHYHVLSEESRKYFTRAIIMSGSALNRWALSEKSEEEDLSNLFKMGIITQFPFTSCESDNIPFEYLFFSYHEAHKLGEKAANTQELIVFLQRIPANELMKHTSNTKFIPSGGEPKKIFVEWNPRIENVSALNPFLIAEPEQILGNTATDISTMFGFASHEWLGFGSQEIGNPFLLKSLNENFHVELPFRGSNLSFESEDYKSLADEIRRFYFGENSVIDGDKLTEYIDMLSDIFFFNHIDRSAKLQANISTGKTFYLRFSIDSDLNVFQILLKMKFPGSSHESDRCYLFRCDLLGEQYHEIFDHPENFDGVAYQAIQHMTKLWSNFAKYGTPTHDSDPIGNFQPISNDVHFLDIRNDGLIPSIAPKQETIDFWHRLHEKYRVILKRMNEIAYA